MWDMGEMPLPANHDLDHHEYCECFEEETTDGQSVMASDTETERYQWTVSEVGT